MIRVHAMEFKTLADTEELFILRLSQRYAGPPQFEVEFMRRPKLTANHPPGLLVASAVVQLDPDDAPAFDKWSFIDPKLRKIRRMLEQAAVEYVVCRVL